jgi:hypothetical protein
MRAISTTNVSSNLLSLHTEAALPTADFLTSNTGGDSSGIVNAFDNGNQAEGPARKTGGPGSVLYTSQEAVNSGGSKFPLWQS